MPEFDFIRPTDKPALLALSTPEYLAACRATLHEMEYKVHNTSEHEDFVARFGQVQYQVAIIEEKFSCHSIEENLALMRLQYMPMGLRRHAVTVLIGESFQSLNTMQAFNQSVHIVIHPSDLGSLKQILQQVIADNDLFLSVYRDTQTRMAQGKI
jgi:hypothetical protein